MLSEKEKNTLFRNIVKKEIEKEELIFQDLNTRAKGFNRQILSENGLVEKTALLSVLSQTASYLQKLRELDNTLKLPRKNSIDELLANNPLLMDLLSKHLDFVLNKVQTEINVNVSGVETLSKEAIIWLYSTAAIDEYEYNLLILALEEKTKESTSQFVKTDIQNIRC